MPRSVCLLVCVADIPEPFLLKLPSAVPLDLLIFEFLVLSCIFSVFLSAGIARSPTASVGRLFSPHCPEDFVEDRKHSLSFSGAGRLAVTRVSDASFSSYHDVAHPAVQVVCSTQNRVTRQSVWRPFLARDSEWNLPNPILKFLDFWCITECLKPRKIAISKAPLDFVPHPGNSGKI